MTTALVTRPKAEIAPLKVDLIPASYDSDAAELLDIRARAKQLYEAADALEERLIERLPVGERLRLRDGRIIALIDNFVSSNVAFRPAAVRHFEVRVVK